jgi:NADH-quinone oxidoreductase subunit C
LTTSPSDAQAEPAARFAELAGAASWSDDFGTIKLRVARERWVPAHRALREELPFFSWLSAVDWAREVAIGEPAAEEELEERYEIVSCLADGARGPAVLLSTDIPKDDAVVDSISGVYGGAEWHEREAAEMFGIDFAGHPNLVRLYLTDGFEGHPLRKSYALLSREVKPWPGDVDVEDMPPTPDEGGEA